VFSAFFAVKISLVMNSTVNGYVSQHFSLSAFQLSVFSISAFPLLMGI